MAKANTNSKKGFTIIEVVLVLAIAGLIFLMVFVALPALQRSQRDTARRNDLARVDTSAVQYQTNNQGTGNNGSNLPTPSKEWEPGEENEFPEECSSNTSCRFVRDYMNSGTSGTQKKNEFQDPDGTYYGFQVLQFGDTETSMADPLKLVNDEIVYDGNEMNHIVYLIVGAQCKGESAIKSSARHFAIVYRLEGAGTYCIDDQ